MEHSNLLKNIKEGIIENIYFFIGQEQFLCEEIINELRKQILDPSFKDLNYEYMEEKNISTQSIISACETLPFMDKWRLVIVKNFDFLQGGNSKENEGEIEKIIKYIKNISPNTCLVFWQTENVDKRKKLFKAIKQEGKLIEFEKLKPFEYEKWLESKISKKGKNIKKTVLRSFMENSNYLSKNSPKTLRDINNEINKIVDYIGDRIEITQDEIGNILSRSLENDIFKMVDAIGKRDKKTAIILLNDMLRNGENGIKILTMITRQFRILIQCRELKNKGYSPDLIAKKLSLAPFIVKKGLAQCQHFKGRTLKEALNTTSQIDLKMKTGKVNIKLALEMLIFEYTK
jgi:DNA polymerase-3 subunit delta